MELEHFILTENAWVPNNERLPVIIYREAVPGRGVAAAKRFEKMFEKNGWPSDWRDGIYDYHHFHSTAHEALGVFAGSATLMLGGPHGKSIEVKAGDALVLPVGIGHRSVKATADFLVVGAYPEGQDWDICRKAPSAPMRARMDRLPLPEQDPIQGKGGPLDRLWSLNPRLD